MLLDNQPRVRGRGRKNQEDGCADFPRCLECPAPVCRYDNLRAFKRWLAETKKNLKDEVKKMAGIKKIRNRWYVVHEITRAPLKRKGRLVGFKTKKEAAAEARATHRRVMG